MPDNNNKAFLPGWSEIAPKRRERKLSAEERARAEVARTGRTPVVFHEPPKAIVGSAWQGKPSGISGWDKRAREAKSTTKDKWAKRAERKRLEAKGKYSRHPARGERILYLAYGSNLHRRTMLQRCPTAVWRGAIMLKHARLVFRGAADVVPANGFTVPVGVWEIGPEDERALDRYEGVSSGTYSKYFIPIDAKGTKALIYMMNDEGIYPPSAWYAGIVRAGYRNFGLDESYLDAAIKDSFENKAHSDATRSRRQRQRSGDVQRDLVEMPAEVAAARAAKLEELNEQREAEMARTDVPWPDPVSDEDVEINPEPSAEEMRKEGGGYEVLD